MGLRYVQLIDALDFGDAVSNHVLRLHQMLVERGDRAEIFSKYADPRVAQYRQPFSEFEIDDHTVVIHHYSGFSEIAPALLKWRCYKIMVYHNITPSNFFDPGSKLYNLCKNGQKQLREIVHHYNLVLGDSKFNCQDIQALGFTNTQELPIVVPPFPEAETSESLGSSLRSVNGQKIDKVWLFVGRIAANKRQDLLLNVFNLYSKSHPQERHHFYLVGRYDDNDPYYQTLRSTIDRLGLQTQVTLCGKVEDEELPSYYQSADLFVCMSEHEGFCVPIVEAFNSKIPVVAFAGTAVKGTVGSSPGLLDSLDVSAAMQKIQAVFENASLREEVIAHGLRQAQKFSQDEVRQRFDQILAGIKAWPDRQQPLTVSVVICTCDRRDFLIRCLEYLQDQDYPHFEVVVVYGPCHDDTATILADRRDVKVVHNPQRNLSISRNLGIQAAAGDIVAFIDDDALPYDNWLSELVKTYQDAPNNVVGVGGRTFFANRLFFQFEAGMSDPFGNADHVLYSDSRIHDLRFYRYLMGTNSSFRRDALCAIDGFDEQYDYFLDETDVAVRLQDRGGQLINANQAYVRHEFAQSHNRLGKYNFNWRVISKNTVYFGMKTAQQSSIITRTWKTTQNIIRKRCLVFLNACLKRDLSWREGTYHSFKALSGWLQGYQDARHPRRLGPYIKQIPPAFLPYHSPSPAAMSHSPDAQTLPSKQRHVLILSQEFPPHSYGGVGVYNQLLAKELMQMGHAVTVISRGLEDRIDTIGSLTHIQVATVPEVALPDSPILAKNLAWAQKAAQIAQEIHLSHPIDVIDSALWDFESIGTLMLRPQFQVPLVVRLVTPLLVAAKMNGWKMSEDFQRCVEMERELVRCADGVIAISQSVQDSFIDAYGAQPDDRWVVQHLGVQPWPSYTNVSNYGELPQDLQRGEIQILFVGRLEGRKGIDIFLKALKTVLPKDPRLSVWIAGNDIEGWQAKAEQWFDRSVRDRIQFLGTVTEERRELLYANCDFLVFPSRYESFGLVPLEAMVHGKPVIGANAAAIPEVVLDGICGLLFTPDQPQDLAEKILQLAGDEAKRAQLAKGAKARVETLSARNMAKASIQYYDSLPTLNPEPRTIDSKLMAHLPVTSSSPADEPRSTAIAPPPELASAEPSSPESASLSEEGKTPLIRQLASLPLDSGSSLPTDWQAKYPNIHGWGFLNPLFNRFVVPKMGQFIASVLHDSMQRQSRINRLLLSQNKGLAEELAQIKADRTLRETQMQEEIQALKQSVEKSLEQAIPSSIESSVQKSLAQSVPSSIESTMQETIGKSIAASVQELKQLLYQTQSLTLSENEATRSEFSYRLKEKDISPSTILNAEKVATHQDQLRINLGCGMASLPDHINVDQRELPGVDVIADVRNLPFQENTLEEIFSSHVVEHFTEFEFVNHLLPYWYGLLKPAGKLVIICPDAESMVMEYAQGNFSWDSLRKVTFGGQDYDGNYHFNMYTAASLCRVLTQAGFKETIVVETKRANGLCYEMEIQAVK